MRKQTCGGTGTRIGSASILTGLVAKEISFCHYSLESFESSGFRAAAGESQKKTSNRANLWRNSVGSSPKPSSIALQPIVQQAVAKFDSTKRYGAIVATPTRQLRGKVTVTSSRTARSSYFFAIPHLHLQENSCIFSCRLGCFI